MVGQTLAAVIGLGHFAGVVANCLEVDGQFGSATKTAFQTFLNDNGAIPPIQPIDGKFESQSTKSLQNFLNSRQTYAGLGLDGSLSSHKVEALQSFLDAYLTVRQIDATVLIDGNWGTQTTRGLQIFLKGQGFDPGAMDALHLPFLAPAPRPYPPPPRGPPGPLTSEPIDRSTCEALQKFLNHEGFYFASVDGKFGSKTKDGLIQYLNMHIGLITDGDLGHDTVAALQYFLNNQEYPGSSFLSIDGSFKSETTTQLQLFLNANSPSCSMNETSPERDPVLRGAAVQRPALKGAPVRPIFENATGNIMLTTKVGFALCPTVCGLVSTFFGEIATEAGCVEMTAGMVALCQLAGGGPEDPATWVCASIGVTDLDEACVAAVEAGEVFGRPECLDVCGPVR